MTRINVYTSTDVYSNDVTLAGWFNPDTATRFDQAKEWDGQNMVGVITRSQWIDEYLYRTQGGRWVLRNDASRYRSGPDTYEFLTDEQAKDWLLQSDCNDDAVERYFGEIEEERGPGRPEIGPAVNVRFPQDLLDAVDAWAKAEGVSRAAMLRDLVAAALANPRQ